jgi:hypothetical protein
MASKKKITFVSPKGTAKYPHITEKDTGHQYSSGKYDTQIVMSKADAAPLVEQLKNIVKEEFPAKFQAKLPFKEDEDGNIVFKAKSEYQPVLIDARGKKMEKVPAGLRIRGGSTIRIAGNVNVYDKGISLWLNQVQILELVADNLAFGADEGSFSADAFDDEESNSAFEGADAEAL